MAVPSLEEISTQLDSPNLRDRMVALASLKDVPAEEAVPLIKKCWMMSLCNYDQWQYLPWELNQLQSATLFW